MKAERLIEALSMVGDDPARIQQLRQIVVALAISGKLDNDEATLSPSQVLEAINSVKAELVRQKSIPKPKKSHSVSADQLPEDFADPARFAPLGELAGIEKGRTGIKHAQPGPFPLVVTGAERATCDHFDFEGSAAIIPLVSSTGHGNASINRLHYQEGRFALGTILAAVFPYDPALMSARFLFEYLSAFKDELLVSRMTGTANVTLSVGRIAEVPVPLVCPGVQLRVDELMALCDRLEAAREKREATRDRLTAASLARLNQPDPDDQAFKTDAARTLQALAPLTTRLDQIKQLRQTILNLAVRGKLVPQDPSDEPAAELLKRLRAVQKKAFAEENLRKRKPVCRAIRDELPFGFPASWELPSFDDLFVIVSGVTKGGRVSADVAVELPYLRVANVQRGHLDLAVIKKIVVKKSDQERYQLRDGDILMTEGGDWDKLGRAAIWRNEIPDCIHQNHIFRVRSPSQEISPEWVVVYVNSELGRSFFEDASKQTTNLASINMTQLRGCPIPLPPLAEQHRIVAKVYEIMALCNRLEASLDYAAATRAKLLDTLLHGALDPEARELEAAE